MLRQAAKDTEGREGRERGRTGVKTRGWPEITIPRLQQPEGGREGGKEGARTGVTQRRIKRGR